MVAAAVLVELGAVDVTAVVTVEVMMFVLVLTTVLCEVCVVPPRTGGFGGSRWKMPDRPPPVDTRSPTANPSDGLVK